MDLTARSICIIAVAGIAAGITAGVSLAFVLSRNDEHYRRRRSLRDDKEVVSEFHEEEPSKRKFRTNSRNRRPSMQEAEELFGLNEGFSMEDARIHAEQSAAQAKMQTPKEALVILQKGNARFWMGVSTRPETSAFERRALIMQQYPSVAILGCSDSRVPIEIVFDCGLGDVFVVRVAGNCLDLTTTGSLEYAVHHLKVKVVVVMGHEGCGAVKAATLPHAEIEKESSNLSLMLKQMKSNLDENRLSQVYDNRARDREAVVTNVKSQVECLTSNQGIMDLVRKEELILIGAFYEISSGIVDFFHEVSGSSSPVLKNIKKA